MFNFCAARQVIMRPACKRIPAIVIQRHFMPIAVDARRAAQLAAAGLVLLIASLGAACSTSVQIRNPTPLAQARTVFVMTERTRSELERVADVIALVQKYGYQVTSRAEQADLILRFRFANGVRMAASLELWRRGGRLGGHPDELLLEIESENSLFGTVIARPAARADRINAALQALEAELAKVRPPQLHAPPISAMATTNPLGNRADRPR